MERQSVYFCRGLAVNLRNKLLACLLLHLGFEVQLLKARVWLDDGQTPRWGIGSLRGSLHPLVIKEVGYERVDEIYMCFVDSNMYTLLVQG